MAGSGNLPRPYAVSITCRRLNRLVLCPKRNVTRFLLRPERLEIGIDSAVATC